MRLLTLFVFVISCNVNAQFYNINWGQVEKSPGSLLKIIPKDTTTFYTIRWAGGNNFGHYKLTLHDYLEKIKEKRIKPITETGIGNFEVAFLIGDQLIAFISDKTGQNCQLYAQFYNLELELTGPPQLIAEYTNSKLGSKPNFYIKQSQNRKFLGILWEIPGHKLTSDLYGYRIIDVNLEETQKGEYSIPFDGNMATINEFHLTNNGDLLISITEHNKPNDRLFARSYENYKAIHVYKILHNELKEYSLNIDNRRIDEMQFISDESNFCALTGTFAVGFRQGINGVFELKIDLTNDSIVSEGFYDFSSNISFERFQRNRLDRNYYRRDHWNDIESDQQYTYKLRDIFMMNDGSQVGSIEQFYIYRRMNYDNRTGLSSTIYYYYYDDIIVFKISPDGTMNWEKRINKSQVSVNDNGPYSSYASFCDGKKIYFIFNDNMRNYNELGEYVMTDDRIYPLNLSYRRNIAAICSIDIDSGEIKRNKMFSRKEAKSVVIPKQFSLDRKSKTLMVYALSGFKERFGMLKY